MLKKYTGAGCYRFIDTLDNTIYIGSSKSIHRRLSSHFNGKQGHLGSNVYNQVSRVEVMKCKDYPTALFNEQILIDRYAPKYNSRDKRKNIFNNTYKSDLKEKWELYYKFKELDTDKINLNKKQEIALALVMYFVFIFAIVGYFFT